MGKILYNCPTKNLDEFKILLERASEAGATHVFVTDLYKSRWQWERDLNDPYPNWGMNVDSIFKIIVPDELKGFIPQDFADKNFELISRRSEMLKEYGLKAAFKGCEPAWLVPEVFEKYPTWRGPRFEHPRRALKPYFSPCIDNPEVLEMYRRTMKELCEVVPIEFFQLLTNDSGGGICWSDGLYPGKNGPLQCKHIPFAERITNFMAVLQQGAKDAGVTTDIKVRGSFTKSEVQSAIPYLRPGQSIGLRANGARAKTVMYSSDGETHDYFIGYFSDYYQNDVNPVMGIPQPIQFAKECQEAFASENSNKIVSVQSVEDNLLFDIFKQYKDKKPMTFNSRYQLLRDVAVNETDENRADTLIDIWNHIYDFRNLVNPVNAGGSLLSLGCNNQRWLTRPFVPKPHELTEDEKSYYRRFQFQACGEKAADDLMDLQAYRLVSGHSAAYIVGVILDKGLQELSEAISKCDSLVDIEKYKLLKRRLEVLVCVARTAKNAIMFQEVLDRTDLEEQKEEIPIWHVKSDDRLLKLQEVMLSEIDNINELISLLDGQEIDKLLFVADSEENEDIFLMNPNMVSHLKKKIDIMYNHLMDLNDIFVRFN